MRYLGIVPLLISEISHHLYDQLNESPFEKDFSKCAVLTRPSILCYGLIFVPLSNKFLVPISFIFFEDLCIAVVIVGEWVLLKYCFVIVDNTATQSASFLSKTGLLKRPLTVRSNFSAKTSPKQMKRLYLLLLFLFNKSVKDFREKSFPRSVAIKLGDPFEHKDYFQKRLFLFEHFYFYRNCLSIFAKFINPNQNISITCIIFRNINFWI